MGKKIPISRLTSIENRFNDLRFRGLEESIENKEQFVHSGTGFHLRKNKVLKPNYVWSIYKRGQQRDNRISSYLRTYSNIKLIVK